MNRRATAGLRCAKFACMSIVLRSLLASVLVFGLSAASAQAGDDLVLQARDAVNQKDLARLGLLRDQVLSQRHPLASWVDYWDIGARLSDMQQRDLDGFYARWPGTYVEDRLRNDWLLELGKRRDWENFRREYPRFRMDDDREVHCYWLLTQHLDGRDVTDAARRAWRAQQRDDDGCTLMAQTLAQAGKFRTNDIWLAVRDAVEANRPRAALADGALLPGGTCRAAPARRAQQSGTLPGRAGRRAGARRRRPDGDDGADAAGHLGPRRGGHPAWQLGIAAAAADGRARLGLHRLPCRVAPATRGRRSLRQGLAPGQAGRRWRRLVRRHAGLGCACGAAGWRAGRPGRTALAAAAATGRRDVAGRPGRPHLGLLEGARAAGHGTRRRDRQRRSARRRWRC